MQFCRTMQCLVQSSRQSLTIYWWLINNKDERAGTSVRIEVYAESEDGTGFEFKISTQQGHDNQLINGIITGYNDVEIQYCEILKNCGFSLKGVYQYLEGIGFFKEIATTPIENPNIKEEWVVISEYEVKGT